MKKIFNKILINKNKILISTLVFIFLLGVSFIFTKVSLAQNSGDTFGGQAVRGIEGLSDPGYGLMTCDPDSPDKTKQCTPRAAVQLIIKLAQVFIYIVVISLVIMLIISGLGYVFYGKSPAYLNKWKKKIQNSVSALIIIVVAIGLVLGLLAALGFDSQVLGFLKQILATNNFSPFPHTLAQNIPVPTTEPNDAGGGGYTNFFPQQTIGSLLLLSIKFLVNYIAAPALVIATIYAGFLFVKAQGNPKELQDAKKFALRVVIGIAIAAAAGMIVNILLNTLNEVSDSIK